MFKRNHPSSVGYSAINEEDFLSYSVLISTRIDAKNNQLKELENQIFNAVFGTSSGCRGFYKRGHKLWSIGVILKNLYFCFYNSIPLGIPLDKNFYTKIKGKNTKTLAYADVISIRKLLLEIGWLESSPGSYNLGRVSTNWASGQLAEIFNSIEDNPEDFLRYEPVKELVVLKDRGKGKLPIAESNRIKRKTEKLLLQYNAVVTQSRIGITGLVDWVDDVKCKTELLSPLYQSLNNSILANQNLASTATQLLGISHPYLTYFLLHHHTIWSILESKPCKISKLAYLNHVFHLFELFRHPTAHQLYRVFNNSTFKEGGRFYWTPAQGLPKCLRSKITINSQDVIELDFACYHTNMLYHQIGLNAPSNPYVYTQSSPLREIMKLILNTAYNVSEQTASLRRAATIRSVLSEITFRKTDLMQALIGSSYYVSNGGKSYFAIGEMYDELYVYHEPIQKSFGSNEGMRLQRVDSDIAGEILCHFAGKNIPVLGIHDSFIIQQRFKEELRETMKEIYFNRFKKEIEVK